MSGAALPPVADTVLVAAVDALPARLRKKVDEAVTRFAALPVTAADGRFTVAVDDTTTVTLVADGGVVRSPDAATCTCLLAPNCLHRAAVLALAPAYAEGDPTGPSQDTAPADELPDAAEQFPGSPQTTAGTASDPSAATASDSTASTASDSTGGTASDSTAGTASDSTGGTAVPAEAVAEPLTVQQRAAVEQLWRAAVDVLAAGVTGSGTVARTALLRAAHEGQACKVYRPATAARVVAAMLQAARSGDPDFRLGDLTAALQELIGVLQRLRSAGAGPAEGLLGAARRAYELQGSLRLHGLCTTAVLADSGYAGVVTYVADRDGGLWMIADLMPGDARRAAKAGNATVALGETALSHRALTRAGLVVSGATASATRQLGAGRSVRAVTAGGCGWHEEPLAGLWRVPLDEQVHRAFGALALPVTDRRAGDDLVFLSVRIDGTTNGDAVAATASSGAPLTLRVADDSPALAYRDNLRFLGRATGLELLVVARPDPARPGTVFPLSVAPVDGTGWNLPAAQAGHVDLAFDRLHRSHLPRPEGTAVPDDDDPGDHPVGATPGEAGPPVIGTTGDPVLRLLAAQVERTVSGGRTVHTFAAGRGPSDATRLRRGRLDTGAVLLDRLTEAACTRPRDTFGRLAGDDGSAFAQAWLATAVYTDAATRAVAEATWLPAAAP
ncbi:SWIM zinc finger family protein [Dactylosporangium siamense]|uniref:SWIM-type domain-containing protein n=1 Tax=Dactylosporangium siamense TaxID=685454 RepID=A0A919PID8_9ACTN|nr:SWIM zinc finger family protein [Dactylosporangium siamense]GIG42773.1 hypothetical protein Dsi01nite_008140 [Dactylosporangium siamense]